MIPKGTQIMLVEDSLGIAVMYQRGGKMFDPDYEIDTAIRQAIAYDEVGDPVIILSRLPAPLMAIFPASTFVDRAGELVRKPVRAGRVPVGHS